MIIPDTLQDWNSYYQGCYLKIRPEKEWLWVYAHDFKQHPEHGRLAIKYSIGSGDPKWMELRTNPLNIDATFPDCHYYFLDGQSLLLTRRARRQTTKGLNEETSFWFNPLTRVVPPNFHADLLKNVGYPKVLKLLHQGLSDFALPSAQKMLDSGKALTVPLKKEWCLSMSPSDKYKYLLWYRLAPAGYFNANDRVIVDNAPFYQEVKDVFGQEVQVVQ